MEYFLTGVIIGLIGWGIYLGWKKLSREKPPIPNGQLKRTKPAHREEVVGEETTNNPRPKGPLNKES